jgi:precorrin-2 dehydrogenase / sirohydrochlorin ferrochelatase
MGYLPIFLDVTERRCVVIGGGKVAERKIEALVDAGARVTVISPVVTSAITRWAAAGRITHAAREYHPGDIDGATVVFAATDNPALHRSIAAEANERRVPINVADKPDLCTFIAPAVAKRGALQIAVSTSGAAPAFAARICGEIEDQFGAEYALTLEILRAARAWIRTRVRQQRERAHILTILANADLPDLVRLGDFASIDRILANAFGAEASLAALGLDPTKLISPPGAAFARRV